MTYDFIINYVTGEFETGTTFADSLDEAIENIIDLEDIDEIVSVKFSYTVRHSAYFENCDLVDRLLK